MKTQLSNKYPFTLPEKKNCKSVSINENKNRNKDKIN